MNSTLQRKMWWHFTHKNTYTYVNDARPDKLLQPHLSHQAWRETNSYLLLLFHDIFMKILTVAVKIKENLPVNAEDITLLDVVVDVDLSKAGGKSCSR